MSWFGWVSAIAVGWLAAAAVVVAWFWRVSGKAGPRPVPGDTHLHVVYDDDSYPVMSDDVFDVEREGL